MPSNGWSDGAAGPDGLAALVVAGLHLPATYYVEIRASLWRAMEKMYKDPRWSEVRCSEDAHKLIQEYL